MNRVLIPLAAAASLFSARCTPSKPDRSSLSGGVSEPQRQVPEDPMPDGGRSQKDEQKRQAIIRERGQMVRLLGFDREEIAIVDGIPVAVFCGEAAKEGDAFLKATGRGGIELGKYFRRYVSSLDILREVGTEVEDTTVICIAVKESGTPCTTPCLPQ